MMCDHSTSDMDAAAERKGVAAGRQTGATAPSGDSFYRSSHLLREVH